MFFAALAVAWQSTITRKQVIDAKLDDDVLVQLFLAKFDRGIGQRLLSDASFQVKIPAQTQPEQQQQSQQHHHQGQQFDAVEIDENEATVAKEKMQVDSAAAFDENLVYNTCRLLFVCSFLFCLYTSCYGCRCNKQSFDIF